MTAALFSMNNNDVVMGALFGKPLAETSEYIRNNVNAYISNAARSVQDSQFVSMIKDRWDSITNSNISRQIDLYKRKLDNVWLTDTVKCLRTLEAMQAAAPVMQSHIMAHPATRVLFEDGSINGYTGSYVEVYPRRTIDEHYIPYRDIMSGVVVAPRDESDPKGASYTQYYDGRTPRELLNSMDKLLIRKTWGAIDKHIAVSNIDYTSMDNETIG